MKNFYKITLFIDNNLVMFYKYLKIKKEFKYYQTFKKYDDLN